MVNFKGKFMIIRQVMPNEKDQYNALVSHPVQSWEWGEFRENLGGEFVRLGKFEGREMKSAIMATLHTIPRKIPLIGGYKVMNVPRCMAVDADMIEGLKKTAREHQVIFVKIEPNVYKVISKEEEKVDSYEWGWPADQNLVCGENSFAKYSSLINLKLSDQELLANMKQKTRYNLRLAEKKEVVVKENNSDEAFEVYLKLTKETTQRQKFYAHTEKYHRLMWHHLHKAGIARMLTAVYKNKIISTWVLFVWGKKLYYPYGASSREYQDVMANNLMMWSAIQYGKALKLDEFDLWGTLGPEAKEDNPWFGFHKFKTGFGPIDIEFVETKDLVIDKNRYKLFGFMNKTRKKLLKVKAAIIEKIN